MAGPTPGALTIASMRCKLRHSPTSHVSFKRVGIKQPMMSVRESRRNRMLNLGIDADETITSLAGDSSMVTIGIDGIGSGIQIIDPNNRYKKPKSKLRDTDMGMLTSLENDESVQRLPAIQLTNIDSKDKAFFT